ncbi:MAG: hypothetical protein EOO81_00030 [Oxalobacteraceae bacterium]|nr:MAG: hypothetical protein EOO81_00030 [Oxalobacteraceae bacterium]
MGNVAPLQGIEKLMTIMKLSVSALALLIFGVVANAQEMATCKEPQGYAFYPYKGLNKKETAGWEKDGISGGIFSLKRLNADEWDILFIDTTKSIRSSKHEGGIIKLLRAAEKEMTFLVYYPGSTLEIFTFLQEKDGKNSFHVITSKGGDTAFLPKSSILVGTCGQIQFLK